MYDCFIFFLWREAEKKKKTMGSEPNVALCIDIDVYLYVHTLYTH